MLDENDMYVILYELTQWFNKIPNSTATAYYAANTRINWILKYMKIEKKKIECIRSLTREQTRYFSMIKDDW